MSLDLNMVRVGAVLTARGKAFHSLGAAAEKAWSPFSFNRVAGTFRTIWSVDLSVLVGWGRVMRSERYGGDRPCRALKVNRRILKLILNLTGSQWRDIRTGVM